MSNSGYSRELLQDKPDTRTCQQDEYHGKKQNYLILLNVQENPAFSQCPIIDIEQSRSADGRQSSLESPCVPL
jgi:hypothetical protein